MNVTPASLPGSGTTDSRRPYFRGLGFLGPWGARSREVEVEGPRAQGPGPSLGPGGATSIELPPRGDC